MLKSIADIFQNKIQMFCIVFCDCKKFKAHVLDPLNLNDKTPYAILPNIFLIIYNTLEYFVLFSKYFLYLKN